MLAQMVKSPPAMWETWVPSVGWKILWRIPRTEEPGGLQSGVAESDMTEQIPFHLCLLNLRACLRHLGKCLTDADAQAPRIPLH